MRNGSRNLGTNWVEELRTEKVEEGGGGDKVERGERVWRASQEGKKYGSLLSCFRGYRESSLMKLEVFSNVLKKGTAPRPSAQFKSGAPCYRATRPKSYTVTFPSHLH